MLNKQTLPNKPVVLVVDGHNMLYRGYYAIKFDKSNAKVDSPTNAIKGFSRVSRCPTQSSINTMHEGARKILNPIFAEALKEFKKVRSEEKKAATKKEREAIKEANAALAKIGLKAVRSHTGVSVVKIEEQL